LVIDKARERSLKEITRGPVGLCRSHGLTLKMKEGRKYVPQESQKYSVQKLNGHVKRIHFDYTLLTVNNWYKI